MLTDLERAEFIALIADSLRSGIVDRGRPSQRCEEPGRNTKASSP